MKFTDAKTDYINYLRHEQGATDATIVTYQSWLNRYERWLAEEQHTSPEIDVALSHALLRRFQYDLSKRGGRGGAGARPRTVRGAFHAIRGLCVFLVKNTAMDSDPTQLLTLPKKDAAERLLVSDQEVAAILLACDKQSNERMAALEKALISGLVYTGLRAQELIDLKIGDLNRHSRKLTVAQGKGKKARTLKPPVSFWTALEVWLAARDKMGCKHDWVWAQDTARRIGYEWLLKRVDDIAARAGFKGQANIKPHSLRHWFATHMLRAGANIKQIQAALGHSTPTTTYIYLHSDEADAEAMEDFAEFDPHSVGTIAQAAPGVHPQGRTQPAPATEPPVKSASGQARRQSPIPRPRPARYASA